jgi:hypothetical protein
MLCSSDLSFLPNSTTQRPIFEIIAGLQRRKRKKKFERCLFLSLSWKESVVAKVIVKMTMTNNVVNIHPTLVLTSNSHLEVQTQGKIES